MFFSKICEQFLLESHKLRRRISFKFVYGYRKSYSLNHVLMSLMKNCKKWSDKKLLFFLSSVKGKLFDFIPHDHLIAQMHESDFSVDAFTFYLYFKNRK